MSIREPHPVPPEPKSRRARPAKAPLSQRVIVEAALRLADSEGLDAVTMRRVAQELDTGPASLYVYVSNRRHLLDLLLDEVMAEITVPPGGSWRERLVGLLENSVATLGKRRGLALVALGTIPTGRNAMSLQERVLGLLREGGLSDAASAWAVDLLALLVTASAVEESMFDVRMAEGEAQEEVLQRVNDAFAALPPEQFPLIAALRPMMLAGSGDERFRWWIEVILSGLAAVPPPVADALAGTPANGGRNRP
ncbi:MAG: TetR/AcrR family transcriptional regulator C-terminal domain-containing protein [Thermomicrobiales bacterium]